MSAPGGASTSTPGRRGDRPAAGSGKEVPPGMPPGTDYGLTLSTRAVPRLLWRIVAGLVFIHVSLQTIKRLGVDVPWDLHLVFNVDDEPTVPSWYSSMALLFASYLLFLTARARAALGFADRRHWYGLAAGFAFMSLDEIAAFHEMVNTFINIEWTIPFGILAAALAFVYAPFVADLPPRTRRRFLVAGVVFLSGALVVEHLTGPEYFPFDMDTPQYVAMSTFEETLEMSGVVLFISAILEYMAGGKQDAGVAVATRVPPANETRETPPPRA
jgi:hypothetical protein